MLVGEVSERQGNKSEARRCGVGGGKVVIKTCIVKVESKSDVNAERSVGQVLTPSIAESAQVLGIVQQLYSREHERADLVGQADR